MAKPLSYDAVERKFSSAFAALQTEVETSLASEIREFTSVTNRSGTQGRAEAREFIVGLLMTLEGLPAASKQKIQKLTGDIETLSALMSEMEG